MGLWNRRGGRIYIYARVHTGLQLLSSTRRWVQAGDLTLLRYFCIREVHSLNTRFDHPRAILRATAYAGDSALLGYSTCRERYRELYYFCLPRAVGIHVGGWRLLSYRKWSQHQVVHSWSDGEGLCRPQQTVTRISASVGAMSLLCLELKA